ncbi:YvrJ family protein [Rossellomorea vietnamensis]|uniref:YvrJ family protein n=1 Tax=Rossellomorea vietnamensis TaxID=218284 RepID=A0A5D4LXS8_9BACI|nr:MULTISPECIES: YvrJ family protein [Bacillaceae]TYR94296.1 YvrJ family protein [Rossellomorea vietnamensis]
MEQGISFISEVGFPIVVTMYLLHRIETKLEAVIESIRMLPQEMRN